MRRHLPVILLVPTALLLSLPPTRAEERTERQVQSTVVPDPILQGIVRNCASLFVDSYQLQLSCVKSEMDAYVELRMYRGRIAIKGERVD